MDLLFTVLHAEGQSLALTHSNPGDLIRGILPKESSIQIHRGQKTKDYTGSVGLLMMSNMTFLYPFKTDLP